MDKHQHGTYRRLNLRARRLRFRYLRWQQLHLSEGVVLILISLILGVMTGIAAAVLKLLEKFLREVLLLGSPVNKPDLRFLIWPVIGIIITSIYKRYVCRQDITTGTRLIKNRLNQKKYHLSIFDIFNPLIGCSITMGFGATGGTEGPTAMSGASIGSCISRWFVLSTSWRRLLLVIGAGAGIAAIFKAPIGGALFTLEVLQMEMTSLPFVALIFACLISSSTAYVLSNFTFDITFVREMAMPPSSLGWVMLLGVFCGLYSIYYNYTKKKSAKFFSSIKNPWIAAIASGVCIGIGVFMFPVLYGEGFNVITDLVNGRFISFTDSGIFAGNDGPLWLLGCFVAVLLLKGALVAASYSGGGIAGDFVPTFFAGAIAGALFCMTINHFIHLDIPIWYFALIGMGAVMAGTIHAPLMAIFLLCETTNTFGYILPYLLAIFTSYAVVKLITPKAWYSETGSDDIQTLLALRQTPDVKTVGLGRGSSVQRSIADKTSNTEDNTPQDQK